MDYKAIIINPLDEENGLNDGIINYLGNDGSEFDHSELLVNYGLDVYGENTIFDILSEGNYIVEYPAFFLTEGYGNIVFLKVSDSKTGKIGLLYLPKDISDKQRKSLLSLSSILKDYNIEVNCDMSLEDGLIESHRDFMHGIDEIVTKVCKNKKKA